ncbi:hypothetical protein UFOVP33_6 [uncultured Caudovirales phage]|uniref:Uncharacterized protein n=1 Tax=uncultured Caudovirales phage TaxID=2100421 RepID=A0A6J5KL21_9CAUD|nr:hypothetical protein UFOVP33_6 [uncultured Caudovirales phage]
MTVETYYAGDTTRVMYQADTDGACESFSALVRVFPWAKQEHYFSLSSPAMHDILQEDVITCCLPMRATKALVGDGYALSNRKFCMQSQTSFLRLYRMFNGVAPDWMPPSAKVLFIGENHEEYGRPFPALAKTFYDLYFMGDCDEIEAAFSLPKRRGAYETLYGVTVVDGKPARVKQYLYDEQAMFSDWDVVYLMHAKQAERASN